MKPARIPFCKQVDSVFEVIGARVRLIFEKPIGLCCNSTKMGKVHLECRTKTVAETGHSDSKHPIASLEILQYIYILTF